MSNIPLFIDEYYKYYYYYNKVVYSYMHPPARFLDYLKTCEDEIEQDNVDQQINKEVKKTLLTLMHLYRIKAQIGSENSLFELNSLSRTMLTSFKKTHPAMIPEFIELFNMSLNDALNWNNKNILEKKGNLTLPSADQGFNRKLVEPIDEYIAKLNRIKAGLSYLNDHCNDPNFVITDTSRSKLEDTYEKTKKYRKDLLDSIKDYFNIIGKRYKADAPTKEPANNLDDNPKLWEEKLIINKADSKDKDPNEISLSSTQKFFDLLVKAAVRNDAEHIYGNGYSVPDIMINYWGTGTGKTLGSLLFLCAEDITDCFITVHSTSMIGQFIGDFSNPVGRQIIKDRLPNCKSIKWERVDEVPNQNSLAQYNLLNESDEVIRRVYFMVYGDLFNTNIDGIKTKNARTELFRSFYKNMWDTCNNPGIKFALIMDEAHTLRNSSGTWKKNIEYFFQGASAGKQNAPTMPIKRTLFMTATLAANHLEQAIEVLDLACNVTATTNDDQLEEVTIKVNAISKEVKHRKTFSKIYKEVLMTFGHSDKYTIKLVMDEIFKMFDENKIKGDTYVDFLSELNAAFKACGIVITRGLGGDEGMPKLNGDRSFMAPTTTVENRGLLFWTNFPFKIPAAFIEDIIELKTMIPSRQGILTNKKFTCDDISWRKVTSAYFNLNTIEMPLIFKEKKNKKNKGASEYADCDLGAFAVEAMMDAMCEINGHSDYRTFLVNYLNKKIEKSAEKGKIYNDDYNFQVITFKKSAGQWVESTIIPDTITLVSKTGKKVDAIQFRVEQFPPIPAEILRESFKDEKMRAVVGMLARLAKNKENGPITVFAEHINGPDGVVHLVRRLQNSYHLADDIPEFFHSCDGNENFEDPTYDYKRVASYTGSFHTEENDVVSFSDLEDRQKLVQQFNSAENWDGKKCKIIILSAAGSTGLTLRNSHVMLDIHVPDDVVVKQQKQGRTVRRNNGGGFTAGFLIEKAKKNGIVRVPIVTEYCFLSGGNSDPKNKTYDEKTMESLKKKVTLGNLQSLAFTSVSLNAELIAEELEAPLKKNYVPIDQWKTLLIPNMKNLLTQ